MNDYRTRESGLFVPANAAGDVGETLYTSGTDRQLIERIPELESGFASGNDDGLAWLALDAYGNGFEFSRAFVGDVTRLARLMYLKNPLILRGVNVKADYVFARAVQISANDDDVNRVIQEFIDDTRNQTTFSAHAIRIQRERELQITGNIFFALVPDVLTGRVRINTISVDEITDIICDPNDRSLAWFYKREWVEKTVDFDTGKVTETKKTLYYRDWRYKDLTRTKIGSVDIASGVYIYHVKTGGFADWKFGVSEIYAALDWSKAYKKFLENWATIVDAYARFAFKATTKHGTRGIAAVKDKLQTRLGLPAADTRPAPSAGSVAIMRDGDDLEPIKTSGATTSAEDGRRLLLMVAATYGLPETFFGDVSVGTLATATSLDRPTELMLSNRQQLWRDIYRDIIDYVIEWAIKAPKGELRTLANVITNEYGEIEIDYNGDTPKVTIDFPSIIETDPEKMINAIVKGSTFDGKNPSIVFDRKLLATMVLTQLGANDIDEWVNKMYPATPDPNDIEPAITDPASDPALQLPADSGSAVPDDSMVAAAEALRTSIDKLYKLFERASETAPDVLADDVLFLR